MNEEFDSDFDINVGSEKTSGLDVLGIYKHCFISGAKNLIPVAIASALWLVTVWIPYINIGTTIAMFTLPIWIAREKKLSPIDLFLGEHRSKMFGFFRLQGLVLAACFVFLLIMGSAAGQMYTMQMLSSVPGGGPSLIKLNGETIGFDTGFWAWVKAILLFACAAVPFFMMTTAWCMAPFLLLDKGLEPSEALKESFRMTEGVRLRVFAIYAVPLVFGALILHVFGGISYIGWLFSAIVIVATSTVVVGLTAQIYSALEAKAE